MTNDLLVYWWFSSACYIHDRGRLVNLYDTAYLNLFFASLTIGLITAMFPARQTRGAA